MKKIFTFAIMAFLLGGLAINASAQEPLKGKTNTKTTTVQTNINEGGLEKTLSDYEKAVEQCVTLFNAIQNNDKPAKPSKKEFKKSLTNAENLKKKVENSITALDRTQVDRFNKIGRAHV